MINTISLSLNKCYLIPVQQQYLLIDTGYTSDKKKFDSQLKKLNINMNDITYLLITHSHDDHVGLVSSITEANPLCRVILHQNAVTKLTTGVNDMGNSRYVNQRVSSVVTLAKHFTTSGFPPYFVKETDIILNHDTSFQTLGIDLEGDIIHTPGHTDDSISVILKDGTCFCGDAAAHMLAPLGTKHCIIVMEDLNEYYKSWTKLLNKGANKIYPGHGKPFSSALLKRDIHKHNSKNMRAAK